MSLLSENVIPGNHGKTFETNATEHEDLENIKTAIQEVEGVNNVAIDEIAFPKKITIHTSSIVKVQDIENAVNRTGFHIVPKSLFPL
ncbi:heavy-metal-associated domain-containing protein [Mariniflexile sp.]|uniref:heavy-metal-associated domain-containing protein n=1 Tax=Mariniflexile sp. TaxID=1979402 RepID=UPI00404855C9